MSTTTAKPLKMSDTALKFGPEWLRALSHGDTAVSPPPSPSLGAPRYKLAQHRYGREEMLALYDKSMKAPDDLNTTPPLYIEKTQLPLALIQMSDDEMRMWQRGVNSDVVLKLMGRSPGPPVASPGPSRGRGGGSMDRGRGRGRGIGGPAVGYSRGMSYEDDEARRDGPPTGYGRGARPFERSQSSSERVWIDRPERNGTEADWNGSTSPRKEFGAVRPAAGDNNWRSREAMKERERAENKEQEEDGWRTAGRGERWAGRTAGWRTERDNEPVVGDKREAWGEGGVGAEPPVRHRPWEDDGRPPGTGYFNNRGGGRGGHLSNRRAWDEGDLPEWVSEDTQGGPVGGTFDSSGAFRDERWSDEEDADGKKKRVLRRRTQEAPQESGEAPSEPKDPPALESVAPAAAAQPSPVHPSPKGQPAARVDEDGLEHAQAVVSTLVAQLVEDEDQPKSSPSPPNASMDQWFYRDPQGEVQGPFNSAEMSEWFTSGYFTMALSVRRACDERYVQLGELTKMWGRLPFMQGAPIPPIKSTDIHPMVAEQEKIQLIQQQMMQQQMFQQQMMQQQQHMMRQQAIISKLSQMEGWNTLSPVQQQQLVNQHMSVPLGDPILQQLRIQMEAQAKLQAEMMRKEHLVNHQVLDPAKHDPIQAFVQQLLGPSKPSNGKPEAALDPIQNLIQQAQQGGDPHIAPGFHGMPPGPGLVPWPPQFQAGPEPPAMTSVWELEKAKVEEAKRQMEHQQQMAEMHRMDEEKRMKEEEDRRRREIQEREDERMRLEEMRREAERQQAAEEMRRRELQQQQQLQQQLEEKRRREEEKRKRDEETKQQQAEEERIRRDEERLRKEEERVLEHQRRQQEALQRLQEQQAAQVKVAQQQQQALQAQAKAAQAMMAPWVQQQQQQQQQQNTGESMAEIQKLQEEKESKERAIMQAQKAEQAARQAALLLQQQQQQALKLRWAKQANSAANSNSAKSLAEIQAEEAAQMARQKEKEAKEKATQQAHLSLSLQAAGAWGASHNNSAWSSGRTAAAVVAQQQQQQSVNHSSAANAGWKSGSVGFWEDPTPVAPQKAVQAVSKSSSVPVASSPAKQVAVAKQPAPSPSQQSTNNNKKNRNVAKDEEAVRKLFGQQPATDKKDSFSQWCFEYLKKVQAPIDVPTFVSFLKDVESPFDVQDYVRSYLGEGKEAKEFARQFLEQRSRWRQMQRNNQQREEDNMCIPAKAVNPGQASDFHEVKSKSKKSKKKMQKVDASLLGFSVSASTDRINVGERDFVDGM